MFAILIIIVLLFILLVWYCQPSEQQYVLDGRTWDVCGNYDDTEGAALLLARAHADLITFMDYLRRKYKISVPDDVIVDRSDIRYRIIDHLLNNYNPDVIYENDPRNDGSSYTLQKGRAMYICLRNKQPPYELVDYDTLLFVILHEISHIANFNSWGHDPQFWIVFRYILHEAKDAGIYVPRDYGMYPVDYCGVHIDNNPYYG